MKSNYLNALSSDKPSVQSAGLKYDTKVGLSFILLSFPLFCCSQFGVLFLLWKSEVAMSDSVIVSVWGITILAALIFMYFVWRWVIQPLDYVKQVVRTMAYGAPKKGLFPNFKIKEYQDLTHSIAFVINENGQKDKALYHTKRRLKTLNDDLKSHQSQLFQSEKMAQLGLLSAGIAHEINNPVGFISSNCKVMSQYLKCVFPLLSEINQYSKSVNNGENDISQMIDKHMKNEDLDYVIEDAIPLIDDTLAGTDRLVDIVLGLKTFARSGAEEDNEFCLNDCIESTLKVVKNELKYKCNVDVSLAQLPKLKGVAGEINQVIVNLLVNASQAIADKGEIKIASSFNKDEVVLTVSDNGVGIPEEIIENIFQPFFTTKKVGVGTGLGLSISLDIINKHGGKFKVHSKEGVGTKFEVIFPV